MKKIEDYQYEVWKPIVGFEKLYEISNHGRVKSLVEMWRDKKPYGRELIMSANKVGKGYLGLQIKKNQEYKRFTIHRLVALHFIPNPNGYKQINHKDGNKVNNHYSNLEWCSAEQNINHAFDTGLNKKVQLNDIHRSMPVIKCDEYGNEIESYPSLIQVQRSTGFKYPNIHHAIKNNSQSHGFFWKYKN